MEEKTKPKMKVKLKDLHRNPYKKWINNGRLNPKQIEKLKPNIKELGLMSSIPVVKRKGKLHLVSHHTRVWVLKDIHGLEHEVEVDLKDYTDAQLFKGMIIENLTQRTGESREEMENCVAVESFLNENLEELSKLRDARRLPRKKRKHLDKQNPKATHKDIAFWIDPTEKVLSHDKVRNNLLIAKKLHPKLQDKVKKKEISPTIALKLSELDDKEQQIDVAKALKKCPEINVKEKSDLIKKYKIAPKDVKISIRKGDKNLVDIDAPNKIDTDIIPNFDERFEQTKENSNRLKQQVTEFTNIFKNEQFPEQYYNLNSSQREKFHYNFLSMFEQIKECYEDTNRLVSNLPDTGLLKKGEETKFIDKLEKMIVYIKGHYLYAINKYHTLLIRFKFEKDFPEMGFQTKKWIKGSEFCRDENGKYIVDNKKIVTTKITIPQFKLYLEKDKKSIGKTPKITKPPEMVNLQKEFDKYLSNFKKQTFELTYRVFEKIQKYSKSAPFLQLTVFKDIIRICFHDTSQDKTIVSVFISPSETNTMGDWYLLVNDLLTCYKLGFNNPIVKESNDKNYFLLEEGAMKALLSRVKIVK
jgi:hypothetical protein